MERIIRGRSATISHTFYVSGVATNPTPDTASVTVTRADGTTFVPAGAVDNSGVGVATITFTPAETALLDTWTLTWTATFAGQAQSFVDTVEIAGDVLFGVKQARDALGDQAYAEDKIAAARTYAETELEKALGFALVPRYARDTTSGRWCRPIRLRPYLRSIRAASVSGTALTASELSALTFSAGFVYGYGWPTGHGNVTVGYEHGLDTPPPGATRAALALAVEYLGGGTGSVDPRAERLITDDGTLVFSASGSQFRAPGVDQWIAANRLVSIA